MSRRLVPLADADARCGGKAAALGRLLRAGLPVPPGVVVLDPLADDAWARELPAVLRGLGPGPVAVRSSARGEDGARASFAGQLRSSLHARTTAAVLAEVRRVAASGREPRVAAYAARAGAPPPGVVPVLVQRRVPAASAGVLLTADPVTGADRVVLEAVRGLGDALVDGRVDPERWVVTDGRAVRQEHPEPPVLAPAQVHALVAVARRAEAVLGGPLDVEWAVAGATTWVLQARPVTGAARAPEQPRDGGAVLAAGTPASPGRAAGPVRVVDDLDGFPGFRAGDVLVCRTTAPAWTPLLARAAAVVTEVGGVLSHAAVVAREFGVPAVTGAAGARSALPDGLPVLVHGSRGLVVAPGAGTSA